MMPERDSERAMREVAAEHPRTRHAEPTGGPGHPFEGGTIMLTAEWDGAWALHLVDGRGSVVPHALTAWDRDRLDKLANELRGIVYRAQWRAAQPPEPSEQP